MSDARNFAAGCDLDAYRQDRQLRYAIERALEIIGEATANLSDEVKARAHPCRGRRCGDSGISSRMPITASIQPGCGW
jgi:hypothetical protein